MKRFDKFLIGMNMLTVLGGGIRIADGLNHSDYDQTAAANAVENVRNGASLSADEAQAYSVYKDDKADKTTGFFQLLMGLSAASFVVAVAAGSAKKKEDEPAPEKQKPSRPACKRLT